MRELLIGCGSNHVKKLPTPNGKDWHDLVTLDMNGAHSPDHVHDLEDIPLPFDDNSFDEIHAYDTLEHTGLQGDWKFFFDQWNDFYRILKPGGFFCGISPHWSSPWAWGDPGHTRIISPECMLFLDRLEYANQVGKTPMTDYRFIYRGDFERKLSVVDEESRQFFFMLQAHKPVRE